MNINELRYAIESSFTGCRSCAEPIDSWPDADPSEPGHKVVYISREALFVGLCSRAHVNELYLAEVKSDEIVTHDVSERMLGRFVRQEDCTHAKKIDFQIGVNETILTSAGMVEGPASGVCCGFCHMKFDIRKGEKEIKTPGRSFRLLGLDGRPIEKDGPDV